jgi:hypothetical protein
MLGKFILSETSMSLLPLVWFGRPIPLDPDKDLDKDLFQIHLQMHKYQKDRFSQIIKIYQTLYQFSQ